ncbi:MAG TPA: TetR family transcriptional regulator [Candidatus Polarisedimenticolia bacterium]|jgi:AcrR family transcriptional regulator|nr:TetR family transcriptional regulator [Candidatus Polarisedimenticolia bacterium]
MQALMAAGEELFAQFGFSGASVDRIARAAGVNKAMINYHFRGKAGLYEAILVANLAPITEKLRVLRGMALPPAERLAEYVALFGSMHAEHPALSAMVLREVLSGGRHLTETSMGQLLGLLDCVREIVATGVSQGVFRPVDPTMTHVTIIGCIVLFFASARFRQRLGSEGRTTGVTPEAPEYVRHAQEFILRGLSATPHPPVVDPPEGRS